MAETAGAAIIDRSESLVMAYSASITGSDSKKSNYTGNTRAFVDWCISSGKDPRHWQTLADYRNHLDASYRPATVCAKIAAVRSFYKWLEKCEVCPNIAGDMESPKLSKEPARSALSVEQARQILAAPDTGAELGCRDRAILSLMIHTGLRCSEVCGIRYRDVEQANTFAGTAGRIIRIKGKGRRDTNDFVQVTDACWIPIAEYLIRYRPKISRDDFLFTSCSSNCYGHGLSRQTISGMVKGYMTACGLIGDRYTGHSLRHTSADLAIISGADLYAVQMHLRHASPAMSERYIHQMQKASADTANRIAELIG